MKGLEEMEGIDIAYCEENEVPFMFFDHQRPWVLNDPVLVNGGLYVIRDIQGFTHYVGKLNYVDISGLVDGENNG